MPWKKGVKRGGKSKEAVPPMEYAVGDVVEMLHNVSQEIRVIKVTARGELFKRAAFEGEEVQLSAFVELSQGGRARGAMQRTGRKLWGFDYQIVRVNGVRRSEVTAELPKCGTAESEAPEPAVAQNGVPPGEPST